MATNNVAGGGTYTVKDKDNLSKIAKELYGDERYLEQLVAANPWLLDSSGNLSGIIRSGQTLKTPLLRKDRAPVVSYDFMNAVYAGAGITPPTTGVAPTVNGELASPSQIGNQQPQSYGLGTPAGGVRQPLPGQRTGDTVRPAAGGSYLQTGAVQPPASGVSNQNFNQQNFVQQTSGNQPNTLTASWDSFLNQQRGQSQLQPFQPASTTGGQRTAPASRPATQPQAPSSGVPSAGFPLSAAFNPATISPNDYADKWATLQAPDLATAAEIRNQIAGITPTAPVPTYDPSYDTGARNFLSTREAGIDPGMTEKRYRQLLRREENQRNAERIYQYTAPYTYGSNTGTPYQNSQAYNRTLSWRVGF